MEGLIFSGSSCMYNIFVKINDQWHVRTIWSSRVHAQTSQIYKKDYQYKNKQYIIKLSIPQACSVSYLRIFLSFFIYTARGPTFFTIFFILVEK